MDELKMVAVIRVSDWTLANRVFPSPPDPVVPQHRATEQTHLRCTWGDCAHLGNSLRHGGTSRSLRVRFEDLASFHDVGGQQVWRAKMCWPKGAPNVPHSPESASLDC
jgi:hypothetical protein